jgi:hypothetical protein
MMALIFRLLGGGWLVYALIAAAFAGGVAAGLRWERGNTLAAKMETQRVVAEIATKAAREAEAAAKEAVRAAEAEAAARIAHEQDKAARAASIAARGAREALSARIRIADLEASRRDILETLRTARQAEPVVHGFSCMFTEPERRRVLDKIPIGRPDAAAQPAAAGPRGARGLPRSRS